MPQLRDRYDYIVVGAGSAGCVIANRLSADPALSVLIIEAGGSDAHPLIQIPMGAAQMTKNKMFSWSYDSEPEPHLDGRRIHAPAGKVLGGSSSINMTSFMRGDQGDYDRWAANGATGWSWADVLPYFRRLESWADGEDALRGGDGPVRVEWGSGADPLFDAWADAFADAGVPRIADSTRGSMYGTARGQCSSSGGRRSSAANAYLKPVLKQRRNLDLVTHAEVSSLSFTGNRAAGVEFRDKSGQTVRVAAEREVILSAGVFNSPRLLMLAGIGPADELRTHGIDVRADLPVGHNLQEHQSFFLFYGRHGRGEMHARMRFDRMARFMLQAYFLRSGPAATMPITLLGFAKTSPDRDVPDLQFMMPPAPPVSHMWFPLVRAPYADGFGIRVCFLHPDSKGRVQLHSADPFAPPKILFNFLSAPGDLERLRAGFHMARSLAHNPAMDAFRDKELVPGAKVDSDEAIDTYIRRSLQTVHHAVGTCAMGSDENSVLDPQLRVRGIEGLRVVDASAMPDLISGQINGAVLMLAERASDLILGKA